MSIIDKVKLWKAICQRLENGNDILRNNWDGRTWDEVIEKLNQITAVERRKQGDKWIDKEIFKGMVLSILSNQINWRNIDNIIDELPLIFNDYDINYYSNLHEEDINNFFIPWFKARNAGSQQLSNSLKNLIKSAKKINQIIDEYESFEKFLSKKLDQFDNDPKGLVRYFADNTSKHKLPGFGIALAAEAFKNIGFDVAKPDRHINRAVGIFGLCNFKNWKNPKKDYSTPEANDEEKIKVMMILEKMASAVNERVVFVDNVIWLLCAESGLHYTNEQLAQIVENL